MRTSGLPAGFEPLLIRAADTLFHNPILTQIADPQRRGTLIGRHGPEGYTFDIQLQGDAETVFFDV